MKNTLLTVGKPKTKHAVLGLQHYAKRLQRHGGLELDSVRQAPDADGRNEVEVMSIEADRLLARLDRRDQVWALDRQGSAWDSRQWAEALDQARLTGAPRLVLVVGGHLGLGRAILERSDRKIAFGPLTLAHELAALVAAEQLYRAHSILAGLPYHR